MDEKKAIKVIKAEKECVTRNWKNENCDRDCCNCDLLMDENDIIESYDMAISALREIQKYSALEQKLRDAYGSCGNFIEIAITYLADYAKDELEGKPGKAQLLTDENVDKWEAYKALGSVEYLEELKERDTEKYRNHVKYAKIWEQEAKKQAAVAGEMRITLAERLEDIRTRISETRQTLLTEDNHLDQVILQWKLEQLREQHEWLEAVLYGKR